MSEATVVIKGRNELSYAVRSAEQSLRGLLKQGELLSKVFRGGAIVGAALAFERLAENAQKAAEQVGDRGTARALAQLNAEIDRLKAKGTNLIGQVLGGIYIGLRGEEIDKLTQDLRGLRREIDNQLGYVGGDRSKLSPRAAALVADLEAKVAELERRIAPLGPSAPLGSFARTAAMSRGGGSDQLVRSEVPKAGASSTRQAAEELWVLTDPVILAGRAWMELGAASDEAMEQISRDMSDFNEEALENLVAPVALAESEWTVFAEQAARNLQDSFAQFLFDPFQQGLDGMLSGFIDVIRRMVAELIAQQVLSSFFGMLAGATTGGVSSFFGTLAGGRAAGGPVSAGSAYLVGEQGPELFMPRSSGTIIPNGGMGGVNVSYSIDARGADADRILAILPAMLRQTEQRTVATVLQMQRQGRFA